MAKREISSTLRNLKFMQRSSLKEEKKKKTEEEPNGNFPSLGTVKKKCVVITDWDPQPGALLGRMSFQSFNPSIEKMNEEAANDGKTEAAPTSSSSNGGRMSFSMYYQNNPGDPSSNRSSNLKPGDPKVEPSQETNGDLKRKQSEVVSERLNHPNKSPRSSDKPSPSNKKGNAFKKPKSKKVDWSVLKPPKSQTK